MVPLDATGRGRRFDPYSAKCKICKQKVHQTGSHYCQGRSVGAGTAAASCWTSHLMAPLAAEPRPSVNAFRAACAYKLGICAMCGRQVLDVKNYKQSAV